MSYISELFKKHFFSKPKRTMPPDFNDYVLVNAGGREIMAATGTTTYIAPREYPTSTASSSGLVDDSEIDLDVAPLRHYIKKWFPFVKDVLEVKTRYRPTIYNPFTFTPRKGDNGLEIHLLVSPTHFAETFSNSGLDNALKKKLNEKLVPLLISMYGDIRLEEATYLFFPEKTETLLEYIR